MNTGKCFLLMQLSINVQAWLHNLYIWKVSKEGRCGNNFPANINTALAIMAFWRSKEKIVTENQTHNSKKKLNWEVLIHCPFQTETYY